MPRVGLILVQTVQQFSEPGRLIEILEKVVSSVVGCMPPNPSVSSKEHFIRVQILAFQDSLMGFSLMDYEGCDILT